VQPVKRGLLELSIDARKRGTKVVGYDAPAKGNTLLNYCGIPSDFLDFTFDRNPYIQGKFAPGDSHHGYAPRPTAGGASDYVFILPWNLKDEIVEALAPVRGCGDKFIVPVPCMECSTDRVSIKCNVYSNPDPRCTVRC
jgi:hypothetical protein